MDIRRQIYKHVFSNQAAELKEFVQSTEFKDQLNMVFNEILLKNADNNTLSILMCLKAVLPLKYIAEKFQPNQKVSQHFIMYLHYKSKVKNGELRYAFKQILYKIIKENSLFDIKIFDDKFDIPISKFGIKEVIQHYKADKVKDYLLTYSDNAEKNKKCWNA